MSYWNNWKDIMNDFEADAKEPDEILFYEYGGGSYDGDAIVAYRIGDKYYTVEGSHCSCMGLEGQWSPEEYDLETFKQVIDRKIENYKTDDCYPSMSHKTYVEIRRKLP